MNRGAIMKATKAAVGELTYRLIIGGVLATMLVTMVNQTRQLITYFTPDHSYFEVVRLEIDDLDMLADGNSEAVRVYFQRTVKTKRPLVIAFSSELRSAETSREFCHASGSAVYHTEQNDKVLTFTRNQWFTAKCSPPPGCYENHNTWTFVVDDIRKQVSKVSNPFSVFRGEEADYCES